MKKEMRKRIAELEESLLFVKSERDYWYKMVDNARNALSVPCENELNRPINTGWLGLPTPQEIISKGLEEENLILKAKLAYAENMWVGVRPLNELLKETREEYRLRVIRDTGIKDPDVSKMKFLEDYLPKPHEDDAKAYSCFKGLDDEIKPGWVDQARSTERNMAQAIKHWIELNNCTEEVLLAAAAWDELKGNE